MSICSMTASGAAPGRDRLGERVEVHDDELEGLDAELGELALVVSRRRSASRPACTPGCSVRTRPSSVLGVPGDLGDLA